VISTKKSLVKLRELEKKYFRYHAANIFQHFVVSMSKAFKRREEKKSSKTGLPLSALYLIIL
jgi:hypothetical protein